MRLFHYLMVLLLQNPKMELKDREKEFLDECFK